MLDEERPAPFLLLGHKYAYALQSAGCIPVAYPLAQPEQLVELLSEVDGVFLTGSPANVHPSHFGESVSDPRLPLDPERDTLTLTLVRACVEHGLPLFGVCRGFQEINVALGGSLHQQVHHVAGMLDHREPEGVPYEAQYAPAHEIHFESDSIFRDWAGGASTKVNSLHGQGVNRLASGLKIHARAPDGLIEAFAIENSPTFAYAVQWHPEWRCWENPFYKNLFQAFAAACQARAHMRKPNTLL